MVQLFFYLKRSPMSAFMTFVFITTFTPGPNNISSASMGMHYGYRRSLSYMLGIFTGFFLIMCLCSAAAALLQDSIRQFEELLSYAGAAYIGYLAWHTFRAEYEFQQDSDPLGFFNGLLLQLLNPKVIIYGLMIYTNFLTDLRTGSALLYLSALLLACCSFTSISVWALFGTLIRRFMHSQRTRRVINTVLSLLLFSTAVSLLI